MDGPTIAEKVSLRYEHLSEGVELNRNETAHGDAREGK